jgi:hypothetical protein
MHPIHNSIQRDQIEIITLRHHQDGKHIYSKTVNED